MTIVIDRSARRVKSFPLTSNNDISERLQVVNAVVTKERLLLVKVLMSVENDPDIRITDVQFSGVVGSAENYSSTIRRASVTAKRSNGNYVQMSFVIKNRLANGDKSKDMSSDEIWTNEEFVYKSLLPTFSMHCKEPMLQPMFYYSDQNVILLEDLAEKGYSMAHRTEGLDYEHTALVMDALAHFHAASLAMQHKDTQGYKAIKEGHRHPYTSSDKLEHVSPYIRQRLLNAVEVVRSHRDSERYSGVVQMLLDLADDQERYLSPLRTAIDGDTAVFIHGDMWLNNVMFAHDPHTMRPVSAKFVDFQATRIGCAPIDIYHLLYTSVRADVRRCRLDSLVDTYHRCRSEHLRRFVDGDVSYVAKFTREGLLEEMHHYRQYGLLNAILMLPMITVDEQGEPFDFFQLDTNNNSPRFKKWLMDVVDEYVDNGWI